MHRMVYFIADKQEATPPQQRRENGRSSTSGTDTNEVGPVPPAPNSVAPSSHSPDSLPSPSRYCIHTDPMNSTTTNPSIHQQVGIASMSSSSSNFSSCRIPGPPPTSHTRKTASASALSSTNSSDPIPLPPQVQNCAGRGGPGGIQLLDFCFWISSQSCCCSYCEPRCFEDIRST